MKRYILALFAITLLFVSCGEKEEEVAVTSVSLTQATAEMLIGETVQLTATVLPSNATEKTITWASSKQSVASVSNSGLVTALAEGTSTVTASCGGKSATCQVTVSKGIVEVTSITLNKEDLSLIKGQSETLVAIVNPSDATDKTVTWDSSDKGVASVDVNGKVTAVAGGNAIITAKAGDKQATCSVTITVPIESISLDQDSITLEEEQSVTLAATVKPDDATDKTVTWSSSDNQIATVDESGKVTAIKEGSAIIIAQAGDKMATCSVTVKAKVIKVTGVSLDKTTLTLTEGDTQTLNAAVTPSNATDKSVTWSSSNSSVAEVSSSGVVIAKTDGNATITVKTTDGGKTASCAVTVNAKVIPVTGISLDKTSVTMTEGDTQTLTATVTPSDATDKSVTWSSSAPAVAEVSSTGIVIARSEGSATITVKTTDGGKTASCSVVVNKKVIPVSSITLNKTSLTLTKGQSETLTATVSPSDATDKTITWSSSNTSVATVDLSGKVTAVGGGSATITAKAGDKQATCTVTVTVPVSSVTLNKTSLALIKGQFETLTATVKPDDATDKKVTWSSSNTSIATVDQNGKVTAISSGSVTITAKVGDKQATCTVTVTVPVTTVSLDRTSVELTEGGSTTLVATVKPDDATDKKITWSSANTSVATVDQNGKVTAIKEGSANITAKAGDKTATCKVTVKQKPYVSSLSLSENSFNGYINKYYSVSVAITPSDAQYDLEWTSSDERVATIQGSGLSRTIYTKDFGATNITVKDKISGKSVSITVSTIVTDFSWKENTGSTYAGYPLITIEVGDEYQLHYSCTPSSATHLFEDLTNFVFYEPTYVVNAPSVISINPEGKMTGVKVGTIGIKPTGRIIKGSSGSDRVYITVRAKTIAVSEVSLNKTYLSLNYGEVETLTATVVPDNAADKTITWTSSNNAVATVDSNGKVTAVAAGSATIIAKVGDKQATCTVTVSDSELAAIDLGLSVKWASFNVGATKPEEYGDYFSWGEIEPKDAYSWETYKWCNGSYGTLTKYNTQSGLGTVDNKTTLDLEDDVSHVKLGGKWRIPTDEEWTELRTKCTWTWTKLKGVSGRLVTGLNGNSIFLPAAGHMEGTDLVNAGSLGYFWSSSLSEKQAPTFAMIVFFNSSVLYRSNGTRSCGQSVRPVLAE